MAKDYQFYDEEEPFHVSPSKPSPALCGLTDTRYYQFPL